MPSNPSVASGRTAAKVFLVRHRDAGKDAPSPHRKGCTVTMAQNRTTGNSVKNAPAVLRRGFSEESEFLPARIRENKRPHKRMENLLCGLVRC
jgi:hypothetical protein